MSLAYFYKDRGAVIADQVQEFMRVQPSPSSTGFAVCVGKCEGGRREKRGREERRRKKSSSDEKKGDREGEEVGEEKGKVLEGGRGGLGGE